MQDSAKPRKLVLQGPWSVKVSKKRNFSPNLNQYRNAHHFTLSKAKREYAKEIKEQLSGIEPMNKVVVTLVAYPPTARDFDNDNLAPHMKFCLDAVVTSGILEDDNYRIVVETRHRVGAIDKENPRVEFHIEEVAMRPDENG